MKRFLLIVSIILLTTISSQAQTRLNPGNGNQTSFIRLYPNPATTSINFDFQKSYDKGYSVQVYNFLGRLVLEQQNLAERSSINLSQFTRGVYIYKLRDKNNQVVETGKFQVAK